MIIQIKNNKYAGIITVLNIFIVIVLIYIGFQIESKQKKDYYFLAYRSCKNYYNTEYKGIITKNYKGRGVYMSILSGNIYFIWYYPIEVKYSDNGFDICNPRIEIGDSIYKPKQSFDTYIYKKANSDSVIFLPYKYDCTVEIRANAKTPKLKIKSISRYIKTQKISQITFNWDFNKEHEKLIKGFLILKTNPDKTIDTSALLSPKTRVYKDSIFKIPTNLDILNGKFVNFEYKIAVVIEGLKLENYTSVYPIKVPYIDWNKYKTDSLNKNRSKYLDEP